MGQILIEGKDVQKDVQNGIGWMKNVAQCNCLYAKEYLGQSLLDHIREVLKGIFNFHHCILSMM